MHYLHEVIRSCKTFSESLFKKKWKKRKFRNKILYLGKKFVENFSSRHIQKAKKMYSRSCARN
jgi:hypothetical protein